MLYYKDVVLTSFIIGIDKVSDLYRQNFTTRIGEVCDKYWQGYWQEVLDKHWEVNTM